MSDVETWMTMRMTTMRNFLCVLQALHVTSSCVRRTLTWNSHYYPRLQAKKLWLRLSSLIKLQQSPDLSNHTAFIQSLYNTAWWLTFTLPRSIKFMASGFSFLKWLTVTSPFSSKVFCDFLFPIKLKFVRVISVFYPWPLEIQWPPTLLDSSLTAAFQ